jgi:hypothetical protein
LLRLTLCLFVDLGRPFYDCSVDAYLEAVLPGGGLGTELSIMPGLPPGWKYIHIPFWRLMGG